MAEICDQVQAGSETPAEREEVYVGKNASANAAATGGDGNGFQTNPANGYIENATFAVDTESGTTTSTSRTNRGRDRHVFNAYDLSSVPSGSTIVGIEV